MGTAARAAAYCRTTTCGPGECTPAADCSFCLEGGLPLYWPRGCVSFSTQKDGSPKLGIAPEVAQQVVADAFTTWISSDCGNGTPSIVVYDFGYVTCDQQEYNQKDGNANIWMFRDGEWPYVGSTATLALTTLTFNVETGEIFDADVEVNSAENEITLPTDPVVKADFASIVVHEAGHFLGLSHSCDEDATMFHSYGFGETFMRDLSADDVAGICAVYPPGQNTGACDPTPRHGYSAQCGDGEEEGCCTTAPGRPGRHAAWALGAALAGLALFGARRRARSANS